MTYWQPKPDIFPSGLTNWLGEPLVLYVPMYSAENLYRASPLYDYEWAVAGNHVSAIPLGRKFYDDLFANGTAAGMIMFEQVGAVRVEDEAWRVKACGSLGRWQRAFVAGGA